LHEREEICTLLKICRRKIKGNKEVFAAVWWDGSSLVDKKCRYLKVFYGNLWL
jgi:hypothetical protein